MAWEHLDLRRQVWVIPGDHARNGKPHLVHLSEPVLAILEAVPRSGELVFSGDGKRMFQGKGQGEARRAVRRERLDAPRSAPDRGLWHGAAGGSAGCG
jgi:integrase